MAGLNKNKVEVERGRKGKRNRKINTETNDEEIRPRALRKYLR